MNLSFQQKEFMLLAAWEILVTFPYSVTSGSDGLTKWSCTEYCKKTIPDPFVNICNIELSCLRNNPRK